jgi:hypothetical protein
MRNQRTTRRRTFSLGERGQIGLGNQSTPAAVDRAIYLRTDKAIYRIEEPAAGSPSSQP